MPRLHCPGPLAQGQVLDLPAVAARHVQVLRLQPGEGVTLFDGSGGEWSATIEKMGRADVRVQVGTHDAVEREAARAVHLAVGIPANDRMDWLVEKAAELGVASLQPLASERSVLRLQGERAQRRQAHWQAIAVAACEQCGRNRVPPVHPIAELAAWQPAVTERHVLSFAPDARPLQDLLGSQAPLLLLSGPEGGLSPREEAAVREAGFRPVSLGRRVLRADTAPLAALAALTLAGAAAGDSR
jgi:16S rRNA (uracil1498-N3)-methyltransferase